MGILEKMAWKYTMLLKLSTLFFVFFILFFSVFVSAKEKTGNYYCEVPTQLLYSGSGRHLSPVLSSMPTPLICSVGESKEFVAMDLSKVVPSHMEITVYNPGQPDKPIVKTYSNPNNRYKMSDSTSIRGYLTRQLRKDGIKTRGWGEAPYQIHFSGVRLKPDTQVCSPDEEKKLATHGYHGTVRLHKCETEIQTVLKPDNLSSEKPVPGDLCTYVERPRIITVRSRSCPKVKLCLASLHCYNSQEMEILYSVNAECRAKIENGQYVCPSAKACVMDESVGLDPEDDAKLASPKPGNAGQSDPASSKRPAPSSGAQ